MILFLGVYRLKSNRLLSIFFLECVLKSDTDHGFLLAFFQYLEIAKNPFSYYLWFRINN